MPFPTFSAEIACWLTFATALASAWAISRSGFPVQADVKRAGCIDGLRGYLALSVFMGHSLIWINMTRSGAAWVGVPLYLFGGLVRLAVPLFFMITGFLFYSRVLRGLAGTNWLGLYISRVFRIVPLVAASTVVISIVIAVRFGVPEGYGAGELVKAWGNWITSTHETPIFRYADSGRLNAYVFWSLKFEWAFYLLILPALAALMTIKPTRLHSCGLPIALLLGSLTMRAATANPAVSYLPLFAIGMLANEAQSRPTLRRLLIGTPCSIVIVACVAVSAAVPSSNVSILCLLLDGVFFVAVASGNSLWGLLRWRASVVLGECSFGIYVLHGIVISLFFGTRAGDGIATNLLPFAIPALAVVVVLVSAGSYLLIERPNIAAGAWLARRITRRKLGLTPAAMEVAP